MKKYLISFFVVFVCTVQIFSKSSIIGGSVSVEPDVAWIGFILSENESLHNDDEFLCAGVLITSKWVLTAAHCLERLVFNPYIEKRADYIWGVTDRSNPGPDYRRIPIERIEFHPEYFQTDTADGRNDLALLQLKEEVNSLHAELPKPSDSVYYPDSLLSVFGWGITDTLVNELSDVLVSVNVDYIPRETCTDSQSYGPKLPENIICAGTKSGHLRGASLGDSGGPLAVKINGRWKILGIVSGGKLNWTTIEFPGKFTEILSYRTWIDETISESTSMSISLPRKNGYNGHFYSPLGRIIHQNRRVNSIIFSGPIEKTNSN